jgi:L-ascorbate metabolism protein UlaG (beta-lactamase superfamily)
MKIHKLGHCCLVIEVNGKRIMTDPGDYSTLQDNEMDIDIILITHEHGDHLHIESLKKVMLNNPQAKVITNSAVGKILEAEEIPFTVLEHGESKNDHGILFEGFGEKHAEITPTWSQVQNTGYFIDDKLFYPGDAFTNPGKPVDILALPVAGPWMKISEAIAYALSIKPRVAFSVHEGGLKQPGVSHKAPEKLLPEQGIEFVPMVEGTVHEF